MVEHNPNATEMPSSQATLWTWSDLCLALGVSPIAGPDVHGVQIDSRIIAQGELFIALAGDPGERFHTSSRSTINGHDYIVAAAKAGAVGAIVEETYKVPADLPSGFQVLRCNDTYDALWTLGRTAAARLRQPKIAVTGSSGKTTAKAMLQIALGGYVAPGSFNNHIGVPLSLANTPATPQASVYEIGTSFPGEVEPLAKMVSPDIAVLVNVGSAHLENFTSFAHLRKEKISIFNGLKDKSNAIWEHSLGLSYGLSFGAVADADVSIIGLQGDQAEISVCGRVVQGRVPGGGRHRAETLCAVLACLHLLDESLDAALEFSDDTIPDGRGRAVKVGGVTIVNDSYNANPDSMKKAIQAFLDRPEANKILVLGEMLELGEHASSAHIGLKSLLQGQQAICIGAGFRELATELAFPWYHQADEAVIDRLKNSFKPDTAVLVKGSNKVFWQQNFVEQLKSVI